MNVPNVGSKDMQSMPRSEIKISNIQIKSLDKARKLCQAIGVIEEECGIKNVKITLENVFVCEWIDLNKLNETDMEKLVQDLLWKI